MLLSGKFVILVQDTPLVAEQATHLLWTHHIALKGADAMHVASALVSGCEEFLTFDGASGGGILGQAGKLLEIGLRAVTPKETNALPRIKDPSPPAC